MTFQPVKPLSPIAPYVGGKRNLAKRLCAMIDAVPHHQYVEPFVGMGGVFFRRSRRPTSEVINDISGDVANLFRILREHADFLTETLRFQLSSREDFERLSLLNPDHLTDLQRAARFVALQCLGFGGLVEGRSFGARRGGPRDGGSRFNPQRLKRRIMAAGDRLSGVTIERRPYQEIIARCDGAGVLFYLDPPYFRTSKGYGVEFGLDDYAALARQLATLRGEFIMTLDDSPEIRATFAAFAPWRIPVTYSVDRASSTKAGELIISSLPREQLER